MHKRTRFANPFRRRESWNLWEAWILATVAGGLIGIGIVALAIAFADNLGTVSSTTLLHIVGGLEGIVLGFTQWLVLRRYVKNIGGWVVATAIGAIVAWLIGLKVIVLLILIFNNQDITQTTPFSLLTAIFCLGVWVGTILGFCQWFVLRIHMQRGLLWVLSNGLAWGLGLLIASIGATLTKPGEFTTQTALIGVTTGATAGAMVGAITGIALVWLLKPRSLRHD